MFSIFSWWLPVERWQKIEVREFFGVKSKEQFFSVRQVCDEPSQFVKVLLSIICHETVEEKFQGSYYAFSNCSCSLIHFTVNLYSTGFANFLNCSLCSFVEQYFLRSILFCIHSRKSRNHFFGYFFVSLSLATRILSSRS